MYSRRFSVEFKSDTESLTIQETDDQVLRVVFDVAVEIGGGRAMADLAIYNLSKSSQSKIEKEFSSVIIRAGYEDNIDVIFSGEIKNALKERQGADFVTRVYCLAQRSAVNKSVISKTLSEGATLKTAITDLANAMSLSAVFGDGDFAKVYPRGKVLTGDPAALLKEIADSNNLEYGIEGGRLIITGKVESRQSPVIVINERSGMIGVPEITEVGTSVTVNLNPALKLKQAIQIESAVPDVQVSSVFYQDVNTAIKKGQYVIQSLVFRGDSWGNDWHTKATGLIKRGV